MLLNVSIFAFMKQVIFDDWIGRLTHYILSGKSTIARFLLRFYDPNQGEIIIDDKYPLTALNVSWWRSQIGYVAQDPVIFPGTIRENIALGKPHSDGPPPTEEEVKNAAKMACAHDFILNLPGVFIVTRIYFIPT